ncbi:inositol monophosphatase family protein [Natronospira bacteriovora]|uniref:Inositol monophosphatase n=1 Tax=Natronospira bacteriovora TaxID=3069753 RepID=A0ABU0W974_9GAMM|nr:inositol monophosphatase [Natronospira sp. AB-CW4]MDQ2070587.1 inositol monophosphatase [Natronospira sp. AB-CW4]
MDSARRAAEAAGRVLHEAFSGGARDVRFKEDQTPVTEVDLAAEAVILQTLKSDWPEHGVWSEESGRDSRDAEFLWLVDPLDGTRSFIRGTPFFSTQIALMHRGRLVAGVSAAPLFGEMAWACEGGGAWLNDEPIRVSDVGGLREATLSAGNLGSLAKDGDAWGRYGDLLTRVERMRGYGDFCHYHLLARGAVDIVVESDVNILDVAALAVIVAEAGGRVSQLDGRPLDLETRDILASNGRLHSAVLRQLAWSR